MKISITNEMVDDLREMVKPYLKNKRYLHTLGVEREAAALGGIFLPDEINKLKCAALLHDITKKLTTEQQIELCEKQGIEVDYRLTSSPKLFHSRTAAELIKTNFPEYADDDIINAVRWHTTGQRDMTMSEAIIYLADYIEDTRTFEDCVKLRSFFYDEIKDCRSEAEQISVFYKTMILSFDLTIKGLISENAPLDTDTIEARNYYISLSRSEV